MSRSKIEYGIDLGTTNSSIARMEQGVCVIKKNEYGGDTTPSCVNYNKKGMVEAGQKAYNTLDSERKKAFKSNDKSFINTFEEFKRVIGTDAGVFCTNLGRKLIPEELSSEVLKKLKSYITDEDMRAVVITVPAKFKGFQTDATMKAARLAGFEHCILLQEPIAASLAYGVDAKTIDGLWVVFDFGGGTFDAALMKADEGIMKVIDTEGDNHLGGKNIDYAIVDHIIIPRIEKNYCLANILKNEERHELLRNALKRQAEVVKIDFSSKESSNILSDTPIGEDEDGNEIELDIDISQEEYEAVVSPIFQRAIDITTKLLAKNNLVGSDLKTVLMIGGPTFSPILRKMVREQITTHINISIDPMTAVAKGAALYASTKDLPEHVKTIDKSKIQLTLKYPETTVETEPLLGIRIEKQKTEENIPEIICIDVIREDKGWSSGRIEIKGDSEVVPLVLKPGVPNGFKLTMTDDKGTIFPCEPDSFSIIHGIKVAGQTLAFDLCIDAYDSSQGRQHLIGFKGLGKNQPLPAKGTAIFQTPKDVRPGNQNDILKIPVYEGEQNTLAICNNFRGIVNINGGQFSQFLPKGSDIELTIEVDESRGVQITAVFPYLDDYNIGPLNPDYQDGTLPKEQLEKEVAKVSQMLKDFREEYADVDSGKIQKLQNEINEISILLEKGGHDADTRQQVHNRIRQTAIDIDMLQRQGEVPKVMREMAEALKHLKMTNEQFGDEQSTRLVQQLSDKANTTTQRKDTIVAKELTQQMHSLDFDLVDKGAGVALEISLLKGMDDEFEMHEWKDRARAKKLIAEAKNIIVSNRATKANLRPIVSELFSLLPRAEQKLLKPDDDVLIK
jgi:molecular chaperone DnaK